MSVIACECECQCIRECVSVRVCASVSANVGVCVSAIVVVIVCASRPADHHSDAPSMAASNTMTELRRPTTFNYGAATIGGSASASGALSTLLSHEQ